MIKNWILWFTAALVFLSIVGTCSACGLCDELFRLGYGCAKISEMKKAEARQILLHKGYSASKIAGLEKRKGTLAASVCKRPSLVVYQPQTQQQRLAVIPAEQAYQRLPEQIDIPPTE